MDSQTTLADLRKQVEQFVTERDWKPFHTPRNLAEAIIIEAAELLEEFQWDKEINKETIKNELADVMIYCLCVANAMHIDVSEAIVNKMVLNAKKYPIK